MNKNLFNVLRVCAKGLGIVIGILVSLPYLILKVLSNKIAEKYYNFIEGEIKFWRNRYPNQ